MKSRNITTVSHGISLEQRWRRHGYKGGVFWFTGLSGSGKSTLAMGLEKTLFDKGYEVYVLDGDNLRHGLSADLGFSEADRRENIRRVGEVAGLFSRAGIVVLTAFISPFASGRRQVRDIVGEGFHEIFLDPGLAICEERDPKGLYKKARAGDIQDFTGISSPYEVPVEAELRIDTGEQTIEASIERLTAYADQVLSVE